MWGTSGREALDRILVRDAIGELAAGHNATRHYGPDGQHGADGISAFIEVFAPPPRMIIFGAVDFTAALASASKFLGYDVTVCDARSAFATEARFPMADRVIVDWPDRYLASLAAPLGARDAVCVLTHDAKFDVPALVTAVTSGVGYVGAMGNRRTHADREIRLREAGLEDGDLARIHAPIGIDIGGRTPEEDTIAADRLLTAARQAGFADARLELEPVAAAYHYERTLTRPELALVADFGAGTTDFCRRRPRRGPARAPGLPGARQGRHVPRDGPRAPDPRLLLLQARALASPAVPRRRPGAGRARAAASRRAASGAHRRPDAHHRHQQRVSPAQGGRAHQGRAVEPTASELRLRRRRGRDPRGRDAPTIRARPRSTACS